MRNHGRTTGTSSDGFRRLEAITRAARRRRWSDKARIVAESLDPATTASAVARRYGLHASQLFAWRQQLQRRASSVRPAKPGLVSTRHSWPVSRTSLSVGAEEVPLEAYSAAVATANSALIAWLC